MADKDVDGVIAGLLGTSALRGARVVATSIGVPRALPAEALAGRWRALGDRAAISDVQAVPDAGEAIDRAISGARGPVIVAGSLYLVGVARGRLVDDPRLRDPEDDGE
jgi:folylpolyglutamate synthase/dihydropteroate synthase